ncbi:MAG: TonB-dependent receptor, partial [Planctomycetota bacterium]|nr:TonB-dependent receptor [Planctomycetota bacterium]
LLANSQWQIANSETITPTARTEEIIVTATRLKEPLEKVTQSISVITAKDIEKSPAKTLKDVLEKEVGVSFAEDAGALGAKKTISLRGSSIEEVLVLVDGRRINSPQSGHYDLAIFPLESIERIEILRGPASSLYGADALGGVINIITKKPTAEPKTTTSFSAGQFDTQLTSLTHSYQIGKLGYFLSTSKETSDGFRDNSYLNQENYTLRLLYEGIDFKTSTLNKEIGLPGTMADPDDWTKASTTNAWQKNKENRFDLGYTTPLSNLGELRTMLFYNVYRLDYFGWGSLSIHKNNNLGFSTQLGAIPLNQQHSLLVGLECFDDRVSSTEIERHRTRRWAGFLQEQFTPNEDLTVIVSGRYDDHSVYGGEFSPKASASYLIGEDTKVRASIGKGYRAPTLDDLYWPDDPAMGARGNKNLKPETSLEYEVGLTHKFSPAISSDFAVFQRDVKDAIKWYEYAPWQYEPGNIGKARFQGVELETAAEISEDTSFKINYSYLNPQDRVKDSYLRYEPRHLVNSGLIYDIPWQNISVSLNVRFVKNYVPHTERSKEWSKYIVSGLKISKGFELPNQTRGNIYLGVENLGDREYMVKKYYPMPGRTVLGGLKFEF